MDEDKVRQIAREEAQTVLGNTLDVISKAFVDAGKSYTLFFNQFGEQIRALTEVTSRLEQTVGKIEKDIHPIVQSFYQDSAFKSKLREKFGAWGEIIETIAKITASFAGIISFVWLVFKYLVNQVQ